MNATFLKKVHPISNANLSFKPQKPGESNRIRTIRFGYTNGGVTDGRFYG